MSVLRGLCKIVQLSNSALITIFPSFPSREENRDEKHPQSIQQIFAGERPAELLFLQLLIDCKTLQYNCDRMTNRFGKSWSRDHHGSTNSSSTYCAGFTRVTWDSDVRVTGRFTRGTLNFARGHGQFGKVSLPLKSLVRVVPLKSIIINIRAVGYAILRISDVTNTLTDCCEMSQIHAYFSLNRVNHEWKSRRFSSGLGVFQPGRSFRNLKGFLLEELTRPILDHFSGVLLD